MSPFNREIQGRITILARQCYPTKWVTLPCQSAYKVGYFGLLTVMLLMVGYWIVILWFSTLMAKKLYRFYYGTTMIGILRSVTICWSLDNLQLLLYHFHWADIKPLMLKKPGELEFLVLVVYIGGVILRSCSIHEKIVGHYMQVAGLTVPEFSNLAFFMHRSRKPLKMLALNFFEINLATYVWILRTGWSTFLVLRGVNQD